MQKEKSTFGWVFAFAGQKRSGYISSVLLAVIGAAFQILPFFVMASVIGKLLAGNRELSGYIADCAVMAAFWLLRVLFHSLSTAQSHRATFAVLANIRKQGLEKLARMPLGDVQARGSGELKNILVERVDSIEPTLAHVIPEMSSNAVVVLATLAYLFALDWRMALASLITLPLGMVFFMLMMLGYEKNYARTVAATNTLNDTAVEYIGGIEVIKAFGKAKSSYEKFVAAAKECAQSYIDWMNKSNFYFTFAINIMPATLLTVLPIGGLLIKNGTLTPEKFVLVVVLSMGLITPIIEEFLSRGAYGKDGRFEARRAAAIKALYSKQEAERKEIEKAIEKEKKKKEKGEKAQVKEKVQRGRAICQLDDAGNVIAVYDSLSQAVETIGVSSKSIRDAANGVQKHAGGFCWKYKDQLEGQ